MPPTALALVLVAAALHAAWNIAAKKAGGDHRFAFFTGIGVAVLWAPVGVWVGVPVVPQWGWAEWSAVIASGMVHVAYFQVLLAGYRHADLTVVYPMARGAGPLVTAAAAVLVLGESLRASSLAGVCAVAVGVLLIAGGPGLWSGGSDAAQRSRLRAGLAWGALTGVLIAGYTVIDGYAVKVLGMSPILVDYFGNLVRVPFLVASVWRGAPGSLREAWRLQWKHALLLAVIAPLGYVLVLYAVQMAPLSHVAPARELSLLFAALFGGRLLGEAALGWRLAGAACIALGVMTLALSG